MITHDQANDLLAVFALDAVAGIEHDQIESHLNECPRCATELRALCDVASALGNCVEPVPDRVWSVISSRLSGTERRAATSALEGAAAYKDDRERRTIVDKDAAVTNRSSLPDRGDLRGGGRRCRRHRARLWPGPDL